MPSTAGTLLLDSMGRRILDSTGKEILTDGTSDCECCPNPCAPCIPVGTCGYSISAACSTVCLTYDLTPYLPCDAFNPNLPTTFTICDIQFAGISGPGAYLFEIDTPNPVIPGDTLRVDVTLNSDCTASWQVKRLADPFDIYEAPGTTGAPCVLSKTSTGATGTVIDSTLDDQTDNTCPVDFTVTLTNDGGCN